MVEKEQEENGKEMNMQDDGSINSRSQTTETKSGEGLKGGEPEHQSSYDEKPESDNLPSEVEGIGSEEDGVHEKKSDWLQRFLSIVQALASIATILVAILTYFTLNEMQTERNNAFRPEIVVAPNSFEGGKIIEGKNLPDSKLMYINSGSFSPDFYYADSPSNDKDFLYLEIPYLTLKNIGQGTARDVQISFSKDWMEEVVEIMNHYYDGDFTFESGMDGDIEYFGLYYPEADGDNDLYLSNSDELVKRITYIPSDESTVIVPIPEDWKKMLAVLYGQAMYSKYWEDRDRVSSSLGFTLNIPDAVINITYSDMQGIPIEEEIVIPWTGQVDYRWLEDETYQSIHLKTGFYEGYIE